MRNIHHGKNLYGKKLPLSRFHRYTNRNCLAMCDLQSAKEKTQFWVIQPKVVENHSIGTQERFRIAKRLQRIFFKGVFLIMLESALKKIFIISRTASRNFFDVVRLIEICNKSLNFINLRFGNLQF